MTETNRIEFKRELTRELDIEREVVAFLNYHEGGMLYIGIDDSGKPIGVQDIDGDMLKIKDRIRNGISPSPMGLFDVMVERIDDIPVIKIFVASGSEKPYYKTKFGLSERGCFIRVGTASEPMTPKQIEDLYAKRVRLSLKNIPSPHKELTFRQLHIYYDSQHLTLNESFAQNPDLLTADGGYNYVAYLLADTNSMSIKLAKYAGTDRDELIENHEYGYCSLLKATDQVLNRLQVENTVKSSIGYPYRTDTPLWNERAVRELVINAIVHNDYFNEVSPKFELFSDRLEITSAGSLPNGMSKTDFFNGVSNPRNKELMRVFRDVDLVESLGTGLQRVLKVYNEENFVFMDNFIRVVIPYAWLPSNSEDGDVIVLENIPVNVLENSEENLIQLTERQINIILRLKETGKMNVLENVLENEKESSASLAEYFGVNERTIRRDLQFLQRQGHIRHIGPDKGGHWELIEKERNTKTINK